ncbi:MAG: hypothetical protein SOX57_01605 [Schaalia hyovaginalis]|nr:hypothetical protein [Schaalia hyovaginalis]MDY3664630.1 hypothetical protein [Schaalia hyovaginalis]MDY4262023.1 hypothetical protein [Schaalia hyovaginalis]MDY5600874.1 hypothetical protein [Schaalia hyovaginalis]
MIAMIADPAQRHEGGADARNKIGPDPMDPGRLWLPRLDSNQ